MTLNLFSSSLCRWHNQLFQLFLLWKYGPLLKRSLYIPYFIHSSPNIFPVATLLHVLGYLCVKIPDYWLQYSCVVVLKENVQLKYMVFRDSKLLTDFANMFEKSAYNFSMFEMAICMICFFFSKVICARKLYFYLKIALF